MPRAKDVPHADWLVTLHQSASLGADLRRERERIAGHLKRAAAALLSATRSRGMPTPREKTYREKHVRQRIAPLYESVCKLLIEIDPPPRHGKGPPPNAAVELVYREAQRLGLSEMQVCRLLCERGEWTDTPEDSKMRYHRIWLRVRKGILKTD